MAFADAIVGVDLISIAMNVIAKRLGCSVVKAKKN